MRLGSRIFSGIIWNAIERFSVQLVQLMTGILLTRLLAPEEFGVFAVLMVFILFSSIFIDSGFSKALIQRSQNTQQDFSSVFYFNLLISILLFLILWLIAPLIASFYGDIKLILQLRVLSITLIFNAAISVPATILVIDLRFKKLANINLTATLISGIIAVVLAYRGMGVWALVIQLMIKSALLILLIYTRIQWRPLSVFSWKVIKNLSNFSVNLFFSTLVNIVVNNLFNLFIAKAISTAQLGFYNRGTQFVDIGFSSINTVLNNTILTSLSKLSTDFEKLRHYFRTILKSTAIIIVPLFLFLALMAEPLVIIVLTEKWLAIVPVLQIFCIARLLTVLCSINMNILYVMGRTDIAFKQQCLKSAIRLIFFGLVFNYGIVAIALGELCATLIHFFIDTFYSRRFVRFSWFAQIKELSPIFYSGIIMSLVIYAITFKIDNQFISLLIALMVSLPSYLVSLRIFRVSELDGLLIRMRSFTSTTDNSIE